MKFRYGLLVMAGILAIAGTTRADEVTVSLGQSSQNLVETGIGDNGGGKAQWFITQGACVAGASTTTCTLSGNYTGSGDGFVSGTYALVTTYDGVGPTYSTGLAAPFTNGPSPLIGISETPGSSFFNFSFLPSDATINLDLNETGGSASIIPIFAGGTFVNGYSLADAGTPTCTGGTACDPFDVGEVNGAVFSDTVTGQSQFATGTVITPPPPGVPEPSSLALLGVGMLALAGLTVKKSL
jgi:hypothetical protein